MSPSWHIPPVDAKCHHTNALKYGQETVWDRTTFPRHYYDEWCGFCCKLFVATQEATQPVVPDPDPYFLWRENIGWHVPRPKDPVYEEVMVDIVWTVKEVVPPAVPTTDEPPAEEPSTDEPAAAWHPTQRVQKPTVIAEEAGIIFVTLTGPYLPDGPELESDTILRLEDLKPPVRNSKLLYVDPNTPTGKKRCSSIKMEPCSAPHKCAFHFKQTSTKRKRSRSKSSTHTPNTSPTLIAQSTAAVYPPWLELPPPLLSCAGNERVECVVSDATVKVSQWLMLTPETHAPWPLTATRLSNVGDEPVEKDESQGVKVSPWLMLAPETRAPWSPTAATLSYERGKPITKDESQGLKYEKSNFLVLTPEFTPTESSATGRRKEPLSSERRETHQWLGLRAEALPQMSRVEVMRRFEN